MKRLLRAIAIAAPLCLFAFGCATHRGVEYDTPHVANPVHWHVHLMKIFGYRDGELHQLHLNIDRVLFGLDYFQEFEESEAIYTRR